MSSVRKRQGGVLVGEPTPKHASLCPEPSRIIESVTDPSRLRAFVRCIPLRKCEEILAKYAVALVSPQAPGIVWRHLDDGHSRHRDILLVANNHGTFPASGWIYANRADGNLVTDSIDGYEYRSYAPECIRRPSMLASIDTTIHGCRDARFSTMLTQESFLAGFMNARNDIFDEVIKIAVHSQKQIHTGPTALRTAVGSTCSRHTHIYPDPCALLGSGWSYERWSEETDCGEYGISVATTHQKTPFQTPWVLSCDARTFWASPIAADLIRNRMFVRSTNRFRVPLDLFIHPCECTSLEGKKWCSLVDLLICRIVENFVAGPKFSALVQDALTSTTENTLYERIREVNVSMFKIAGTEKVQDISFETAPPCVHHALSGKVPFNNYQRYPMVRIAAQLSSITKTPLGVIGGMIIEHLQGAQPDRRRKKWANGIKTASRRGPGLKLPYRCVTHRLPEPKQFGCPFGGGDDGVAMCMCTRTDTDIPLADMTPALMWAFTTPC